MPKEKMFEVKRNHHYVMADYLRRWSHDQKNIWHITPSRKVRLDSIKGLAKQEYFYKAEPLTNRHIQDFMMMFRSSDPDLRYQHLRELEIYLKIQHFSGLPAISGKVAEKNQAVRVLMCNTLENTHALHEREARDVMKILAEGDLAVLESGDNLIKFLNYFGHQITRTRAFKEVVLRTMEATIREYGDDNGLAQRLAESWWFVSYIFGMNIGRSLYLDRKLYKYCLLKNEGSEDFITSDQPIINVHPNLSEGDFSPPDENACDLFYSISPRIAFMVNKSDTFRSGATAVSESFVREVNQKIAKSSERTIFATSQEQAEVYKDLVGHRMEVASAFGLLR